jgi:sigma-B regulation protein RsbU (phosphoserine phosphatase)
MADNNPSLEKLVSSMSDAAHSFAGKAPQSDDLTMLVVRFAPENVLHEEIVLQNNVEEVTRLSTFVKGFLGKLEMDRKTAAGIRLAVEETAVNVINYAYPKGETGTLTILADTNHQEVRFTLIDSGIPFDPTTVLEADTTLDAQNRPIGGLGVLLSRRLTDSISYTRQEGQNVLTLTKSIS